MSQGVGNAGGNGTWSFLTPRRLMRRVTAVESLDGVISQLNGDYDNDSAFIVDMTLLDEKKSGTTTRKGVNRATNLTLLLYFLLKDGSQAVRYQIYVEGTPQIEPSSEQSSSSSAAAGSSSSSSSQDIEDWCLYEEADSAFDESTLVRLIDMPAARYLILISAITDGQVNVVEQHSN